MNKIVKAVIVYLIIGGVVYYIYHYNKKKEVIQKARMEQNKILNEKFTRNYDNEAYILLAIKYNLDRDKIYNLINEYELLVFGLSADRHFKERSSKRIVEVSAAIDNLSEKYNIPKGVIANIIIDHNVLDGVSRCGN